MSDQQSSLDELFTSEGNLKHKIELSPFFLRPVYQYTSAEVKDTTQQELHEYDWLI